MWWAEEGLCSVSANLEVGGGGVLPYIKVVGNLYVIYPPFWTFSGPIESPNYVLTQSH